jgi:hypothetical protein
MTLRCIPAYGSVACVNPRCLDEEGRRPRARMAVDELGRARLVWQNDWWQDTRGITASDVFEAAA